VVCEYFFKEFHPRGGEDYLHEWAVQVDRMLAEGWTVLECCRQRDRPGFWTTVLERPAQEFCRQEAGQDFPGH
jgi:hypothetical protein